MILGVKVLEPDVFTDYRGDLWTIWKKDEFKYLEGINLSTKILRKEGFFC